MAYEKINKNCFPDVKDWSEYDYLFDLIVVEKTNPYLQSHHPLEELYPLLKKIAESNIDRTLRGMLIQLLEENVSL